MTVLFRLRSVRPADRARSIQPHIVGCIPVRMIDLGAQNQAGGRAASNDIVLADALIAPTHANILRKLQSRTNILREAAAPHQHPSMSPRLFNSAQ